jgi:glucan-binding YG repeat protein
VQEVSGSWKQDEKGWWFAKKAGSYCKSEWAQINGSWYHFDSDGYAETGWCLDNGKWYYLGSSCAMQTGWLTDSLDGNRYYLDPVTGEMIVGWIQIDGKWYYFEENTPSASGWTWNETGKCWQYQQNGSHPRGAYVEGKTR